MDYKDLSLLEAKSFVGENELFHGDLAVPGVEFGPGHLYREGVFERPGEHGVMFFVQELDGDGFALDGVHLHGIEVVVKRGIAFKDTFLQGHVGGLAEARHFHGGKVYATDLTGKIILEKQRQVNTGELLIDVSSISPGVYMLHFKTPDEYSGDYTALTRKVVIN